MSDHVMEPVEIAPGLEGWADQEVPCFDPECDGTGEPERDGDLLFYECTVCGSEFGWHRLSVNMDSDGQGFCAVGVPEEVRRQFADRFPNPDAPPSQGTPVQLVRKPR